MVKNIQMCLIAVVLCCASAFSQATMTVNGATDPNGIPDVNAYTSVFREMIANTQMTMDAKISTIGFTDSDDATAFQNEMTAFESQALGAQTGADLIALGNKFAGQVRNVLTPDGWTTFQSFVANKKGHMAMWTYSKGCGPDTTTTLFDIFNLYYGTPNSEWEFYGDGFDYAPNCSCNYVPVGVSLLFQGVLYNGTVTRAGETVTKVVLNGFTTPGAGTGQVNSADFGFSFRNSCTGTVYRADIIDDDEVAYTKFANVGLLNGGNCVKDQGGFWVCSYAVVPICSNTTDPDYKYPNITGPPAYIRDYYFAAWRSIGACTRIIFGNPAHSTSWICGPLWPFNVGTGNITSGVCSYNPRF